MLIKNKILDGFKCFFGFHPRNPNRLIVGQSYYVISCHNGDTPWYEKCPRCDRWHYSRALNKEMEEKNGTLEKIRYDVITIKDLKLWGFSDKIIAENNKSYSLKKYDLNKNYKIVQYLKVGNKVVLTVDINNNEVINIKFVNKGNIKC